MFIIFLSYFYFERWLTILSLPKPKPIAMADYIPLVSDDYKLAFVQSTNKLPSDIQQIIWSKVLEVPPPTTPPPTPRKPPRPSSRLQKLMNNWAKRRI
jgi:hypothetical protein